MEVETSFIGGHQAVVEALAGNTWDTASFFQNHVLYSNFFKVWRLLNL
jgi:hypothetical protein